MEQLIDTFLANNTDIKDAWYHDDYRHNHDIDVFQYAEEATRNKFNLSEDELMDTIEDADQRSEVYVFCEDLKTGIFDVLWEIKEEGQTDYETV